jgi:hypothetical protein
MIRNFFFGAKFPEISFNIAIKMDGGSDNDAKLLRLPLKAKEINIYGRKVNAAPRYNYTYLRLAKEMCEHSKRKIHFLREAISLR